MGTGPETFLVVLSLTGMFAVTVRFLSRFLALSRKLGQPEPSGQSL